MTIRQLVRHDDCKCHKLVSWSRQGLVLLVAHGKLSTISLSESNVVQEKEQITPLLLSVPATVVSTQLDEEIVLLNTTTGQYFGISGIGVEFWTLLQEGPSVESVISKLLSSHSVDEAVLRKDVGDWVSRLLQEGLLETVD